jgi:hypothetical protein
MRRLSRGTKLEQFHEVISARMPDLLCNHEAFAASAHDARREMEIAQAFRVSATKTAPKYHIPES